MPRGASVLRTSSAMPTAFVRNVVVDRLGLRDRFCHPFIAITPEAALEPNLRSNFAGRYILQLLEQGKAMPILGMERYLEVELQALPNVRAWAAPCKESQSVEHGGFDDKATRESVVGLIEGKGVGKLFESGPFNIFC